MSKKEDNSSEKKGNGGEKASTTLTGTVEKIIKPPHPSVPEKVQIDVEEADHLYREIRIVNSLTDEEGNKVGLKLGAQVELTVEADPSETTEPANQKTKDHDEETLKD
jgi:hypothetical protein